MSVGENMATLIFDDPGLGVVSMSASSLQELSENWYLESSNFPIYRGKHKHQ